VPTPPAPMTPPETREGCSSAGDGAGAADDATTRTAARRAEAGRREAMGAALAARMPRDSDDRVAMAVMRVLGRREVWGGEKGLFNSRFDQTEFLICSRRKTKETKKNKKTLLLSPLLSLFSHLFLSPSLFHQATSCTAAIAGNFSRSFCVTATRTVITPAAGPVILTLTSGPSSDTSSRPPPPVPTR